MDCVRKKSHELKKDGKNTTGTKVTFICDIVSHTFLFANSNGRHQFVLATQSG